MTEFSAVWAYNPYTQAALDFLRAQGTAVLPEDVARLTPLGYKNFNLLGRPSFQLPPQVQAGQLRPLRTENFKPLAVNFQ